LFIRAIACNISQTGICPPQEVRWSRPNGVAEETMARAKARKKTEEKIDIRLRVDGSLHQRIQEAADREGNSVAAFIRSAVVRELNRREKEASE
jgi:hypothetical protein